MLKPALYTLFMTSNGYEVETNTASPLAEKFLNTFWWKIKQGVEGNIIKVWERQQDTKETIIMFYKREQGVERNIKIFEKGKTILKKTLICFMQVPRSWRKCCLAKKVLEPYFHFQLSQLIRDCELKYTFYQFAHIAWNFHVFITKLRWVILLFFIQTICGQFGIGWNY